MEVPVVPMEDEDALLEGIGGDSSISPAYGTPEEVVQPSTPPCTSTWPATPTPPTPCWVQERGLMEAWGAASAKPHSPPEVASRIPAAYRRPPTSPHPTATANSEVPEVMELSSEEEEEGTPLPPPICPTADGASPS
ncbi:classical arabinogalactan protein 9-like [Nilaparvata lugens]|uniref:classical arabinogalactan protein 9-like n=1 Tax=Nilaparvata lugens TaxID=108931 RepID=UPI000B97D13B|nr:classical arabinogalactan protein 9-like [Nilaparvata lugens]